MSERTLCSAWIDGDQEPADVSQVAMSALGFPWASALIHARQAFSSGWTFPSSVSGSVRIDGFNPEVGAGSYGGSDALIFRLQRTTGAGWARR